MFAGWISRQQLDVIEYLQEENRVLKERLGGRPCASYYLTPVGYRCTRRSGG